MDHDPLQSWLEAYGRAWEALDPQAAAELYAEDATYQETPFSEPLRGRKAILEYWSHVAHTQKRVKFNFEVLCVRADFGIAHWRASFTRISSTTRVLLDGIFLISLGPDNRCQALREWWTKQVIKIERVHRRMGGSR